MPSQKDPPPIYLTLSWVPGCVVPSWGRFWVCGVSLHLSVPTSQAVMCVCMCHDSCIIPAAGGARVHGECQRQMVGGTEQCGVKGAGGVPRSHRRGPDLKSMCALGLVWEKSVPNWGRGGCGWKAFLDDCVDGKGRLNHRVPQHPLFKRPPHLAPLFLRPIPALPFPPHPAVIPTSQMEEAEAHR